MTRERWRIPDRVFFGIAVAVLALTFGMLVLFYPELPDRIPMHFGVSGQPDAYANKSIWTVFFPFLMQVLVTVGLTLLYRYPRYSNIPGTVLIEIAPTETKNLLYRIIRHSLVVTVVIMNLLFAYIALAIITTALGLASGLNGWMMFLLVLMLVGVNVLYTIWIYKIARTVARAKIQLAQTPPDQPPRP